MVAAPPRRALATDLDVDVCVIGGGLAGLTVALELARRGRSVAILEAKQVAWDASSNNVGVVAPGFSERIERIVERVGLERARILWALSEAGVDYVRRTISETGMQAAAPVFGQLIVQKIDDEQGCRANVNLLRDTFGTDAEYWPIERVRAMLHSSAYFQAVHQAAAFRIHPLNYALGLAAVAESAGVRIFEGTPALAIDSDGVRKQIKTPAGRVRAAHIVLAAGGDGAPLYPLLTGTAVRLARHMAITEPLGERLADAVGFAGTIEHRDYPSPRYHVIDGRLLWASPLTTALAPPRRLAARLRRQIVRHYPQLRGVKLAQTWSGSMAYAVHRMPQIGEIAPGLWLASAFADHGINTTAMAGDLVARGIHEGDDRWRLFSSYGLVWAGGRFGRAAIAATLTALAAQAWFKETFARRRDAWRGDKPAAPDSAPESDQPPDPALAESIKPASPRVEGKKVRPRTRRKTVAPDVAETAAPSADTDSSSKGPEQPRRRTAKATATAAPSEALVAPPTDSGTP